VERIVRFAKGRPPRCYAKRADERVRGKGRSRTCPDSDFDGLTDPQEVHQYNTHPWVPDTDGDGLSDRYEVDGGSDPLVNNKTS
jgi:hypothetical protein